MCKFLFWNLFRDLVLSACSLAGFVQLAQCYQPTDCRLQKWPNQHRLLNIGLQEYRNYTTSSEHSVTLFCTAFMVFRARAFQSLLIASNRCTARCILYNGPLLRPSRYWALHIRTGNAAVWKNSGFGPQHLGDTTWFSHVFTGTCVAILPETSLWIVQRGNNKKKHSVFFRNPSTLIRFRLKTHTFRLH